MSSSLQLARLLQLASPALPVGAYTYSQGLEWAVESGVIRDEESAGRWIGDLLQHGIGRYEAPLVFALMAALKAVPLGQAAGQRLLASLGSAIPSAAVDALKLPESEWSNFTPAFAIASARHETQYSRLFRS